MLLLVLVQMGEMVEPILYFLMEDTVVQVLVVVVTVLINMVAVVELALY